MLRSIMLALLAHAALVGVAEVEVPFVVGLLCLVLGVSHAHRLCVYSFDMRGRFLFPEPPVQWRSEEPRVVKDCISGMAAYN